MNYPRDKNRTGKFSDYFENPAQTLVCEGFGGMPDALIEHCLVHGYYWA